MIKKLEEINDGEICLDSEYNPEYDDWYNSMADEILFYDPEHLTDDIETAYRAGSFGSYYRCR